MSKGDGEGDEDGDVFYLLLSALVDHGGNKTDPYFKSVQEMKLPDRSQTKMETFTSLPSSSPIPPKKSLFSRSEQMS